MTLNELDALHGSVESVTFRNEENGYSVVEISAEQELVTVVGILPAISPGDTVEIQGRWVNHSTFGRQFEAQHCERSAPESAAAMLKYLSSGSIRGIGPRLAERLVSKFGDETFEVLENHPEQVSTVHGFSYTKAQEMSQEFKQQVSLRLAMVHLEKYGLTPSESLRVYGELGPAAEEVIGRNPYVLTSSTIGVSFEKADTIAAKIGIDESSSVRATAGIVHVLRHNLHNGHTCVPRRKIFSPTGQLLGISEDDIEKAVVQLVAEQRVIEHEVASEPFLFLPYAFEAEQNIAQRLNVMLKFPAVSHKATSESIDKAEKKAGIQFEKLQREAIVTAIEKGLLILTGGPGTGKTTALNGILHIFEEENLNIALAAPTGRAAQRMKELTGRDAKTIHRLLEVEWVEGARVQTFARNTENPLDANVLIVDELSMVDIFLFSSLLDAMPLGCRLVLVGDEDQLPPVGAGNVLKDMIESHLLPVVELKTIFRQAQESLIVTNAHRIVHGKTPQLDVTSSDFFLMSRNAPYPTANTIVELYTQRLPSAYNYVPTLNIQILCPSRRGVVGTNSLNNMVQEELNPSSPKKDEFTILSQVLRVGDKVMQNRNNYDISWTRGSESGLGVFNGDIGILTEIDIRAGYLLVEFDDKTALYETEYANEIELAYAITVHKSQGSEFEAVIMPMISIPAPLKYRNLLYTAVTRAKELMILVGRREDVVQMVENSRMSKRYSALKSFLGEGRS